MNKLCLLTMLLLPACTSPRAVPRAILDDGWIEARLRESGEFDHLLEDPARFRLQILVSEVVEDGGRPRLVRHGFRVDEEYFYPASAIKTCATISALAALDRIDGVDEHSPLALHPLFEDEEFEYRDETNLDDGAITVHHEIRKLFLVSDNRAYNRLYELSGHREINEAMWAAGLESVRLHHRLSEFRSVEDNRRSPEITFHVASFENRFVPERESDLELENDGRFRRLDVGEAHVSGGERVEGPMSFRTKNAISLVDLQDLNVLLLRPDIDLGKPGFELSDERRALLAGVMAEYPSRSENPRYSAAEYPLDWGKFLLPGLTRVVPEAELVIHNKVGRAYGFSIENALVVHRPTGRSFFCTAVLQTNANETLNDGVYEYEEVADPFFADLGEVLASSLLLRPAR